VGSQTSANAPKFSVIVPAFNAEITLRDCLKALNDQTALKADYEVIVVDDGSSDDTSKIAKQYNVKCVYQTNLGPAAARNRGASGAKGKIILFTDADCIPDRNWIYEMALPFEDSKVMGVKGAYKTRQTQLAARFAQAEFEDRYDLLQQHASIDMIDTYSAAFRKDIFEQMGGFDERFTSANNEDTDFSYRLAAAGYKMVFNARAFVYHTHPDTLAKYLRVKFWRGYWRMVVYRRYPNKAVKDSYTPGVIKIQALSMALALSLFLFSWLIPGLLYLGLLFSFIILLSSFPFSFKVYRRDRALALASPMFVFLRAFVFSIGSFLGLVRSLLWPQGAGFSQMQ